MVSHTDMFPNIINKILHRHDKTHPRMFELIENQTVKMLKKRVELRSSTGTGRIPRSSTRPARRTLWSRDSSSLCWPSFSLTGTAVASTVSTNISTLYRPAGASTSARCFLGLCNGYKPGAGSLSRIKTQNSSAKGEEKGQKQGKRRQER